MGELQPAVNVTELADTIVEYINSLSPAPMRLTFSRSGNHNQVYEFENYGARLRRVDENAANFGDTANIVIFPLDNSDQPFLELASSIIVDVGTAIEIREQSLIVTLCNCCYLMEIWDLSYPYPNQPITFDQFCAPVSIPGTPTEQGEDPAVPVEDKECIENVIVLNLRPRIYIPLNTGIWESIYKSDAMLIASGQDPRGYCPSGDPACEHTPRVQHNPNACP